MAAAARTASGAVEAVYDYHAADGAHAFSTVRVKLETGKTYRPVCPSGAGWQIGDPPGALPLFSLPSLVEAKEILVVEGEKCALVAETMGFSATTSAHGASSASKSDWRPLRGKRVIILPDSDAAGRRYAVDVGNLLARIDPPATVQVLELDGLRAGGDLADWYELHRGRGLADQDIAESLSERLESAIPFRGWHSADSADCAEPGVVPSWKSPLPLLEPPRLPEFPIDSAFPGYLERLREFAVAVSVAYQVPVDAVATLLLPVLALPLSKRFEVEPQSGWREQLSIYVVVLLPSGDRKTAVMSLLTSPIYAWQRDQASGLAASIAEHENELGIVQEKLRGARKRAAKTAESDGTDSDELSRLFARLQSEAPRIPRLIATEATTEAIAQMLVENDERGLIAAAEGDALDVMLGRYSGAPNFGVWLSGHSGDPVDSLRRGRAPDQLAHPALQVALCVQPQAVNELMASRAAEGRGLLARILFSGPKSLVGYRELTPPPISTSLIDWYGTRLQSHLNQGLAQEPTVVRLDPEASELLLDFRRQNEADLRPDGALGQHRSWGSKLPGSIVRIAGIFRTFVPGGAPPNIDAETMRCALAWAPYLTAHYQGVLHLAGDDAGAALAIRIDRWIRRRGVSTFSRRDAFSQVKGPAAPHVEDIDPALDLLIERNRIRLRPSEPRTGPGRRPSASFEVNPAVFDLTSEDPAQNPQNPQNPGASGTSREVQP